MAQEDPFDDPDVKRNVYGNDNAYDENPGSANIDMAKVANYIPKEQQQQIAMSAGSAVANQAANQVRSDYEEAQKTQTNQHERPPAPNFCVNLYNWFPLRWCAFLGGLLLIAGPILDLIFGGPAFIQFFIYLYLMVFGIIICFVESPTWGCTRYFQLKFFFWFRLLSRMWGRAWTYLFISILCYAGVENEQGAAVFTVVSGAYVTLIAILSFIYSRNAAKKFARMREFVAAGAETEERAGRFLRKFDELQEKSAKPGAIGTTQVVLLAEQAGRILANTEADAIQTFLDESCNGYVTKEDFMKQFVEQYEAKGFKQRFL